MRPPARTPAWPARARPPAATLCVLALLAALARAGNAPGAQLAITLQGADGRALAGAVITARPLEEPARRATPVHALMDQVDRAFVPDLLVIPVGSTVAFPNSDAVSHQIYSFSPAKRFQLPLYRGKPYPPVHFEQAGVVTLGCNIHDEMLAYLLVTDAPYFTCWSPMRLTSAARTPLESGRSRCRADVTRSGSGTRAHATSTPTSRATSASGTATARTSRCAC